MVCNGIHLAMLEYWDSFAIVCMPCAVCKLYSDMTFLFTACLFYSIVYVLYCGNGIVVNMGNDRIFELAAPSSNMAVRGSTGLTRTKYYRIFIFWVGLDDET